MISGNIKAQGSPPRLIVIIGLIIVPLIIVISAKVAMECGWAWRCPVVSVLGVPCPSCGSTRAFAALAEMDLLGAVRFNPLVVFGVLGVPFLGMIQRAPERVRRYGWTVFGAVVLLNWVYLYLFLPR